MKIRTILVSLVLLFLFLLLPARAQTCEGGPAGGPPPAVFAPPPEPELAKIAQPALRDELLRMAGADQQARSAGG